MESGEDGRGPRRRPGAERDAPRACAERGRKWSRELPLPGTCRNAVGGGGVGASCACAGSQSQKPRRRWRRRAASRKYKNEVVGLRLPSVVPREPRRAPPRRQHPLFVGCSLWRRAPGLSSACFARRPLILVQPEPWGRSRSEHHGAGGLVSLGAPPRPPAPRSRWHPRWVWVGEGREPRRDLAAWDPRRNPRAGEGGGAVRTPRREVSDRPGARSH